MTAETRAVVEQQVQRANAFHADLRGEVGLPADPAGDTVIRVAQGSAMGSSMTSLVAIRSNSAWRIEWVDSDLKRSDGSRTPARLVIIPVPQADGRRLDAILSDPAFFRQPIYEPHPGCYDGSSNLIEIRTAKARWTGLQLCTVGLPASAVTDILYNLRPAG